MCMICYAVLHMHINQLNFVRKAELSGSFEGTQKLETEFPSNVTCQDPLGTYHLLEM